jgi:GntR family transcriptional regulator of abcA and norABC
MTDPDSLTPILTRDSPTPLYQQLHDYLYTLIVNGELAPGSRLPASRLWAERLGIARVSVVTAYEGLITQGVVVSRDRRGLYVADRLPIPVTRAALSLQDGDFVDSSPATSQQPFPPLISFSAGSLPAEFMPVAAMREAINRVLDRDAGTALGYEPTEGYPPLRRAIAESVYTVGITASSTQVLVTGGCQQAIDLAVQSLAPTGSAILTTDPTYIGLIDIARARGLDLITIPYTRDGLDFSELTRIVEERQPRLFYVMTTFHNPTGTVLPLSQRRRLLAFARDHHLPILEDGVYDGLAYEGETIQPLKALDSEGVVLYASGFSKTVVPGARIGYLIPPERLYGRIARIKQAADVCTPGLNQRAMAELLTSGALAAHLESVRHACKRRRDALHRSLSENVDRQWRWSVPKGGLYLWVELPSTGVAASDLLARSRGEGVEFALGTDFSTQGRWTHALRLNFTTHPPAVIEEGIRRLAAIYYSHSVESG